MFTRNSIDALRMSLRSTRGKMPDFIKGVINLRGVIVLNVCGRVIGMVVDGVSDVIALTPEQIHATPEFGSSLDTQYLIGMGTVDERMIILVDIEQLMSSRDMELIDKAAA